MVSRVNEFLNSSFSQVSSVRTAFLQSVISFLGSTQENLAWTILQDATSNPKLVLDDALFALLAVCPVKPLTVESDVQVAYISDPGILTDMAKNAIPSQCHEMYTENVIYPLSQLGLVIPESSLNVNEKKIKVVRERLLLLQQSAYHAIFSHFLTASTAHVFAQRGFDAAKKVALSDAPGVDLFPYFVYGIGKCVALDSQCWEVLYQLVNFLASAVGSPGNEPTKTSLKAIRRLDSMKLGSNMTFQSPELLTTRLTVDRMSLLEPLARYGCDHFAMTFWERRFHLFSCKRHRVSLGGQDGIISSELDEARNLLLELIRLSGDLQCDLTQLTSKTVLLMDTASAHVADTLVEDLLSGSYGLDFIWIKELRLEILSRRVRKTVEYARSLAAFQTLVSNYHSSFYAQHWVKIKTLVVDALKSDPLKKSVPEVCVATLLDPIFDRAESSGLDSHILHRILETLPNVILRHRPQWAMEKISTVLFSLNPWQTNYNACLPAIQLVEFVNTTSFQQISTLPRHDSRMNQPEVSSLAALLVEAIYSGALNNFDLGAVISSAQAMGPALTYPYFITNQDDGSGGDIEDRRSKAAVPQLLDRYQEWKSKYALQYLSDGVHKNRIPPSMPEILHHILWKFPRLALIHPSLFLSYAVLTFSGSDLDTKTKTDRVLSPLQLALTPHRQGESGTRWGWAPPLSLTLSFAQILFTETTNEVVDAVLDEYSDVASTTCKLAALKLLQWWANTLYVEGKGDLWPIVKTMVQGEGRESLMRHYDELRVLACRDNSRVVREKAFLMRAGDSL